MINETIDHVEQTWDHVRQGDSTTAEKLEVGAELAVAAVGVAAVTRLGLSRCFSSAKAIGKFESAVPKLESALPKLELEGSSVLTAPARPRIRITKTIDPNPDAPFKFREPDPAHESFLRSLDSLKMSESLLDRRSPTYLVTSGDSGKWFKATWVEDKSVQVAFTGRKVAALSDGSVNLGAEERILLQHFGGPDNPALNEGLARAVDKIISCHPEKLPLWARIKHVLPEHRGPIWPGIRELNIEADGRVILDPMNNNTVADGIARSLLVSAKPTKFAAPTKAVAEGSSTISSRSFSG